MAFSSSTYRLILSLLILHFYSSSLTAAESHGAVGYSIEWGTGHQAYTYIFSGQITCHGRPCPNATIHVELESDGRETVTDTATPDSEGRYQVEVQLPGSVDATADWRLIAQVPNNDLPAEVEGRVILTDESTVVVERPIELQQS